MSVRIRLFAAYREAAGTAAAELELPDGATVRDVARALTGQFPALVGLLDIGRAAVNREFADLGDLVRDGDEVAFIPPVSGG